MNLPALTLILLLAATGVAQNCPALTTRNASLKKVSERQSIDPAYVGSVSLVVEVSDSGKIVGVRVENSTSKELEKRAVEEVKAWRRMEPAMKDGKPVAVMIHVESDYVRTQNCEIILKPPSSPAEKSR